MARRFRLEAGLTQAQVAGLARSTNEAVRRIERGEIVHVQLGTLLRIAGVLECGAADLLPVLRAVRERPKRAAAAVRGEDNQHSGAAEGLEARNIAGGVAVGR